MKCSRYRTGATRCFGLTFLLMYSDSQCAEFRKRLERYDPDGFCQERTLALYSASIAYAYPEGQKALLSRGSKDGIESESYYEIIPGC